jgi:hypothetical protein
VNKKLPSRDFYKHNIIIEFSLCRVKINISLRDYVKNGPDELDLVVIIRKLKDFFVKWPKRSAQLFSVGCGGEGKGEKILIILIQKPTTVEGRENLKLSVNVHRKETSSVIVDIKKMVELQPKILSIQLSTLINKQGHRNNKRITSISRIIENNK